MKLIILDRDGVINQDRDDFVKSADEWVPLPGSMDAIAFLTQAESADKLPPNTLVFDDLLAFSQFLIKTPAAETA